MDLKRKNYDYEQEIMWKKGINLSNTTTGGKPGEKSSNNADKAIPKPGYGKYDLDTGLSPEKKAQILSKKPRPKTAHAKRQDDEFHRYYEEIKRRKEVHVLNEKDAKN